MTALTAPSSNAVPTSGSKKIKPNTAPMTIPGTKMPWKKFGIFR